MWWFKKKVKEKEAEPKYERHEGRFMVIVNKDSNEYSVDVYDNWSTPYLPKEDRGKGYVHCRSGYHIYKEGETDEVIEKTINKRVEETKDE